MDSTPAADHATLREADCRTSRLDRSRSEAPAASMRTDPAHSTSLAAAALRQQQRVSADLTASGAAAGEVPPGRPSETSSLFCSCHSAAGRPTRRSASVQPRRRVTRRSLAAATDCAAAFELAEALPTLSRSSDTRHDRREEAPRRAQRTRPRHRPRQRTRDLVEGTAFIARDDAASRRVASWPGDIAKYVSPSGTKRSPGESGKRDGRSRVDVDRRWKRSGSDQPRVTGWSGPETSTT